MNTTVEIFPTPEGLWGWRATADETGELIGCNAGPGVNLKSDAFIQVWRLTEGATADNHYTFRSIELETPRYDLIAEGHHPPCTPCPQSWGCIYCDQDELPVGGDDE